MIKFIKKEELKMVIDALLFSSCSDVISNHTDEDRMKMIDIAIKLKENPTRDIALFYGKSCTCEEPLIAELIDKNFLIKHEK